MPDRAAGPLSARVVEALPSALFTVELESAGRPRATVHLAPEAGLLRVRPGDEVLVQLSPLDPGRGRIVGVSRPLGGPGAAGFGKRTPDGVK